MHAVKLGLAFVLFGLGFAGTGHAVNITVWVYGDGQTSRMLSEFNKLNHSGITVVRQEQLPTATVMEGNGPVAWGNIPDLDTRIRNDLYGNPAWPNVIHIGYNASAASYVYCAAPGWTTSGLANVALSEAQAIANAANDVNSFGITVLLSKGAGIPNASPLYQCMHQAYNDVTFDVAYLTNSYPWMDFSGYTASLYTPNPAWYLDPSAPTSDLWEHKVANNTPPDYVHIGENCTDYKFPFGPNAHSDTAECTSATGLNLGSYRVANSVLAAYRAFQ